MRRTACLCVGLVTFACGPRPSVRTGTPTSLDAGLCRRGAGCANAPATDLPVLRRMWGSAPDDVWAIGDRGVILHFDGRVWQHVPSGTTSDLSGIAGRARGDAWIVGKDGAILRLQGATWAPESLKSDGGAGAFPAGTSLADVWVAADGTAWVAGGLSAGESSVCVLGRHEDGRWTFDHDEGKPLTAIWGTGPDDVWARGEALVHWNGRCLLAHPRETPPLPRGRHGFAGGWRLGSNQRLTHPVRPAPPAQAGQKEAPRVQDFWAFGTDDVWAAIRGALLHFDGHSWTSNPQPR
jgi:hypothetical protein